MRETVFRRGIGDPLGKGSFQACFFSFVFNTFLPLFQFFFSDINLIEFHFCV